MAKRKIRLGDEVVDSVTGFKGKAVAEANYLFGCKQFWVQPPVDEKGRWIKPMWIDEPSLKLVTKPKPKPKKPKQKDERFGEARYGGEREHPDPNDDNEEE